jgi:hypothetical protein
MFETGNFSMTIDSFRKAEPGGFTSKYRENPAAIMINKGIIMIPASNRIRKKEKLHSPSRKDDEEPYLSFL